MRSWTRKGSRLTVRVIRGLSAVSQRQWFVALPVALATGCSSPPSPTPPVEFVSLSISYTRGATSEPATDQVTVYGYQCNASNNPKVPPWYCIMRSSDGRTFVCDSAFTVPAYASPCDNRMNVRITVPPSGHGGPQFEQTARGISVNGQVITRSSVDFLNVEYAAFSVSPAGQVY
jgi:hypothetical protein